jgi:ribonuclease P protein component
VPRSLTLPKKCRLLKNKEFRAVLAGKNRRSDHLLVVHMLANGLDYTRIGVSVGRAQGNSVARNRIKRVIREAFRLHQREIPCGFDILVTMIKPRRGRLEKESVVSISGRTFSLVAMSDSLLKLVGLCHKKILDS